MVSPSRDFFIERIRVFNHTLQSQILLDNALTDIDHNERARFLRNGLSITAFNILEDFIKTRIGEVLSIISNSGVSFSRLPEKIQEISLLSSLRGVHRVSKRKKDNNEDWKLFIQQETAKISSTISSPFTLSQYSIGWENSNLSKTDIEAFWAYFKAANLWANVNGITRVIGHTIPFPDQFFQNAALRRHAAAHDPNSIVLFPDLEAYGLSVKSFAFALDALLSQSARFILDKDSHYLTTDKKISFTDIKIRFIKKVNNQFKEMSQNNARCIGLFTTMDDAVRSLRGRHNYNNEFIVVSETSTNTLHWFTGF